MAQQKDSHGYNNTDSGSNCRFIIHDIINKNKIKATDLVTDDYHIVIVSNYIRHLMISANSKTGFPGNFSEAERLYFKFCKLRKLQSVAFNKVNYGLSFGPTHFYSFEAIKTFLSVANRENLYWESGVNEFMNNILIPFSIYDKTYGNLIESIRDFATLVHLFIGIGNCDFIINMYQEFAAINWDWCNNEQFQKKFIRKIATIVRQEKARICKLFNRGLYANS